MDIIGDVQEAPEEVNESNNNLTGLAAVFHALKSKAKKNDGSSQRKETAEDVVNAYFEEDLEERRTLLWWSNFEASSLDNKIKLALRKVARKYLTPCPTSTNCERLKKSTKVCDNKQRQSGLLSKIKF